MKAYKVFRVKDGRLFSVIVNDKACIRYSPKKESTGKFFRYLIWKKIQLPIFAYKSLTSAKDMKAKMEINTRKKKNLSFHYETWEVKGQKSYKKFRRSCISELERGRYFPLEIGLPFPSDTIFLRTCTPIKRVE